MAFPQDWGPTPEFAAMQITAEGVPLRVRTRPLSGVVCIGAEEPAFCRTSALEEDANEGSTDEHAEDVSSVFFVVKGCPTASNDMLVKKGEYEGGFSIWECTWDLLGFLRKTDNDEAKHARDLVSRGHALDLGCGHGLLGIWALKSGAHAVVFQDLNEDVLNLATRWNIMKSAGEGCLGSTLPHKHELSASTGSLFPPPTAAHLGEGGRAYTDALRNPTADVDTRQRMVASSFPLLHGRALCVAASWENYPEIFCSCQRTRTKTTREIEASSKTKPVPETSSETVPDKERSGVTALPETGMTTETIRQARQKGVQFSVIFCSEGIYREEAFEPLAELFKRLLHKDGIALVASKRYYFGIGGGSLAFISFLREKYAAALSVQVAASFRGVNSNNFRDVLLIRSSANPAKSMVV